MCYQSVRIIIAIAIFKNEIVYSNQIEDEYVFIFAHRRGFIFYFAKVQLAILQKESMHLQVLCGN